MNINEDWVASYLKFFYWFYWSLYLNFSF